MSKLDDVSADDCIRALGKVGFEVVRRKGSHIHLKKPGHRYLVTVPDHRRLKRGTLQSIIRAAGLTVEEFEALLD